MFFIVFVIFVGTAAATASYAYNKKAKIANVITAPVEIDHPIFDMVLWRTRGTIFASWQGQTWFPYIIVEVDPHFYVAYGEYHLKVVLVSSYSADSDDDLHFVYYEVYRV